MNGKPRTYERVADLDFDLGDLRSLPRPGRVLMTSPAHFDVQYVINPHMEGNIGEVDGTEAGRQWRTLKEAYETLGFTVNVIEGEDGLADMVFCANQTLPFYRAATGERGVVMSRMSAPQRRGEVDYYEHFFRKLDFEVIHLPEIDGTTFEGMGDAIWHPRKYLLWGGYGIRTSRDVYQVISQKLEVPTILLRLEDEDFYHLDTCFSPLDESTVLIYPGAFDSDDLAMIHGIFERVLEAPEDEARTLFACNAHCPDGEHVLIQKGCTATVRRLQEAGFSALEVDTGEFLKAGGSVFCMKQMFW